MKVETTSKVIQRITTTDPAVGTGRNEKEREREPLEGVTRN